MSTAIPPPPGRPVRGLRSGSLAGRLVWFAVLVAASSVLVTGLVNLGTYRLGARTAGQLALARDADLAVTLLAGQGGAQSAELASLRREVTGRGVVIDVVPARRRAAGQLDPPFSTDDLVVLLRTDRLSTSRAVSGQEWLIEGRISAQRAVLAAQPTARAVAGVGPPRRRLVLSLLLGLLGGGIAGLVLARQTARPLDRLAGAARRLAAGERDVRVPEDGPAELAQVAGALNSLAAALTDSEARQRRFLLDVSHELRTPLTAVSGYAEALADGVLTGPQVPEAGRVIRDEAGRLQHRVEDLLALARLEADDFRIEPAPTDLTALLAAAALAWAPRAQARQVTLRVEAPPDGLVLRTDAERLRQVLDALLDNALRVLPAGAPLVLAGGREPDGTVRMEVRDGGPGLAPQDLAVAFERGRLTERYRGDRPVGSGLGLALVAELARRLGGTAQARQAPEGGAAFAVLLPPGQSVR